MEIIRHGLSIGIEREGNEFYLAMKIAGKLSHDDYEVIVPMLESALEGIKEPSIKALVDITELEGWELRAAWDDLRFGLKHGGEFSKIAIIGSKKWEEVMTKVASWFIAGDAQYFEEGDAARKWLSEKTE
jgi:hypothetical protein